MFFSRFQEFYRYQSKKQAAVCPGRREKSPSNARTCSQYSELSICEPDFPGRSLAFYEAS